LALQIQKGGIKQIYPVAVTKIGGLDRCWPLRWSHEFSTKLASTRRGSTHWSTQKIARLPENQSQPYGERLVRTIPADGHRF
jgi:hypothetical protein